MGRKRRLINNPKFVIKNKNHPIRKRRESSTEERIELRIENFEIIQDMAPKIQEDLDSKLEVAPIVEIKKEVEPPVVKKTNRTAKSTSRKKTTTKKSFSRTRTKKSTSRG